MIARGFIKQEYFEMDVAEVDEVDRQRIQQIKNALNLARVSRPSPSDLEQRGIIHHGAVEDPVLAQQLHHDRLQSITNELENFFPERPTKQQLLEDGRVFSQPINDNAPSEDLFGDSDDDNLDNVPLIGHNYTLKGPSVDYYRNGNNKRPSIEMQRPINHLDDGYHSPTIPEVPDRISAIGSSMRIAPEQFGAAPKNHGQFAEIVMNNVNYHNNKVIDPCYEVDVLVPEPDLADIVIQSSSLSFVNVCDSLQTLIREKIARAKFHYINGMKTKSKELQTLKNLLRKLQEYGLAIVPMIER
jgi:hypothetical protein